MENKEIKRQYDKTNMLSTAYGILRDRYNRRAKWMDRTMIILSSVLSVTIFMDASMLVFLRCNPMTIKFALGATSLIVSILSLVQYSVDWKQKANSYENAFNEILKLKTKLSIADKCGLDFDERKQEKLCEETYNELARLPSIPDKQFLALKAAHKRKVAVSKYIDSHGSSPYWVIRFNFFTKKSLKRNNSNDK